MDTADTYIFDRITVNPARCSGRPTIRGTRLTVTNILDFLGAGDSVEDMLDEYPQLEREDVLACIQFATATVREKYEPQEVIY
ncbi:DUF433 domain-containing protein [Hymenobacter coccineus]|uniref:Antitoxin n=1 Tax=Hymenobacter coccineus TaxID=1908235 RepID=A0A1G1TDL6_9BACT|nr:DUF433 domain-containing protein [Hymenobacter coccineus]OGX88960.1 hypothetical protein BEN49_09860 [Hymenobacter coccineus]